MARQAAIDFGCKGTPENSEKQHVTHEIQTGTPSVVVTTTLLHAHPTGTVDDPQNEELTTKPRGFFADQFEVKHLF